MKHCVFNVYNFLFYCTLWSFTLLLIFVNAEDAVPVSAHVASQLNEENITITSETEVKNTITENVEVKSDSEISDKLHSSFDEPPVDSASTFNKPHHVEASQNSGIPNEVSNGGQAVIFTLVDTATAELQQRADIPSAITSHNETPNLIKNNLTENHTVLISTLPDDNKTEEIEIENRSDDILNTQQTDTITEVPSIEPKENLSISNAAQEDIPSFSEWAQKQLEQAEKDKDQVNSSAQNHNVNGKSSSSVKLRSKNYASPDCGAKIVAANPEAQSANSVLSPSRDEYKLNACTSRIWFVVELCEAIQAKKIDLANFELFSSSPKDFSVSVSDRFPSREWANVGHFTAKDERDIQSFDLFPHLFGKYIKVEIKSHHGSEHFCPISLFRVYGTSEFEVLEKEDPVHANTIDDDDDDETLDSDNGELPKNLFSSATDAVISIVKKAAEVLGNKGNISNQTNEQDKNKNSFKYTPLINSCSTPSHLVVCDNCSDVLFGQVYELLSCRPRQLRNLIIIPLIKNTLYNSNICIEYGLDFRSKRTSIISNVYISYIKSFFPTRYLSALCNTIAVIENKVVLNVSNQCSNNITEDVKEQNNDNIVNIETSEPHILKSDVVESIANDKTSKIQPTDELTIEKLDLSTTKASIPTDISYTSQIKPTRAYTPEQHLSRNTLSSVDNTENSDWVQPTESFNLHGDQIDINGNNNDNNNKPSTPLEQVENSAENLSDFEATTESVETLDDHLEHFISEFKEDSSSSAPSVTVTPTPQAQKESVFLRLSNRIKALERNMSLSSQYLEELSRRYKKQVEEMQKLLEKTLTSLTEESKKKDERNQQLEEQINVLTAAVETLIAEKHSWTFMWYCILFLTFVTATFWTFCRRNPEFKQYGIDDRKKNTEIQRRKSIDVVIHKPVVKKRRRPSEEALRIAGTYEHLLVDESDTRKYKSKEKKKRKKKQLARSNSITTLLEEVDGSYRSSSSDAGLQFKPMRVWNHNEPFTIKTPSDWVEGSLIQNGVQEIPFVLDESEHSTLEPLPCAPETPNIAKPVDNLKLPSFIKTATDSRLNRSSSHNGSIQSNSSKKKNEVHRKSASVDETKRQNSPVPSLNGNTSLNGSLDDPKTPKKEKKGFKRIFKKVF